MKKKLFIFAALLVLLVACAAVAYAANYPNGSVIGWGELTSVTSIDGHNVTVVLPIYNDAGEITNKDTFTVLELVKPTCTEKGIVKVKCGSDVGGPHDHYLYIKEFGHAWASKYPAPGVQLPYEYSDLGDVVDPALVGQNNWGEIDKPATCTEEGHAHDVCLRCGLDNYEVGRVIAKTAHQYLWDFDTAAEQGIPFMHHKLTAEDVKKNSKYFKVVTPATCVEIGFARRLCKVCLTEDMDLIDGKPMARLVIPATGHNWTDWVIKEKPTCAKAGEAERFCTLCSAHVVLNELTVDRFAADSAEKKFYDEKLAKLNSAWVALVKPEATDDQKATTLANIKDKKVKAEIRIDWQKSCYDHAVRYYCPYCDGEYHADVDDTSLKNVAHIWNEKPQANGALVYKTVAQVLNALKNKPDFWDVDKFLEEEVVKPAITGLYSVPATCELPGWNIYLCQKDEEIGAATAGDYAGKKTHYTLADQTKHRDDAVKVEKVEALGHNWTPWETKMTSEKDGKTYILRTCTCNNCGETLEEVVEYDPEVKDGLVLDDDGKLRWYNNGIPSTATGLTLITQENAWYYLENGCVKTDLTGFVPAFTRQWLVKNGKLVSGNDGLVEFDGCFYAISGGMLWDDWTGVWWKDGKNYLLSVGQWKKDFSGVIIDDEGNYILIKDGSVDFETTEYQGHKVINGIIQM